MNIYRLNETHVVVMNMWNQCFFDGEVKLEGHYKLYINLKTKEFLVRQFGGYGTLTWFPKVAGEFLALDDVTKAYVLEHARQRLAYSTASYSWLTLWDINLDKAIEYFGEDIVDIIDGLTDYLEWEDFDDLLGNYMMMAEDFDQKDDDVRDYREELEARGCLFVTDEAPEEDDTEWCTFEWSPILGRPILKDYHPSFTPYERNM